MTNEKEVPEVPARVPATKVSAPPPVPDGTEISAPPAVPDRERRPAGLLPLKERFQVQFRWDISSSPVLQQDHIDALMASLEKLGVDLAGVKITSEGLLHDSGEVLPCDHVPEGCRVVGVKSSYYGSHEGGDETLHLAVPEGVPFPASFRTGHGEYGCNWREDFDLLPLQIRTAVQIWWDGGWQFLAVPEEGDQSAPATVAALANWIDELIASLADAATDDELEHRLLQICKLGRDIYGNVLTCIQVATSLTSQVAAAFCKTLQELAWTEADILAAVPAVFRLQQLCAHAAQSGESAVEKVATAAEVGAFLEAAHDCLVKLQDRAWQVRDEIESALISIAGDRKAPTSARLLAFAALPTQPHIVEKNPPLKALLSALLTGENLVVRLAAAKSAINSGRSENTTPAPVIVIVDIIAGATGSLRTEAEDFLRELRYHDLLYPGLAAARSGADAAVSAAATALLEFLQGDPSDYVRARAAAVLSGDILPA